jgi:transcriptional regulator with XRE-family HTH domain
MKDRITKFLKIEGISPAEFADKIGVQRSSVSHVLNGRNYPSASFIQKMLGVYKTLNSRWLLLGEGAIFETKATQIKVEPTLFQIPAETSKSLVGEKIKVEDSSLKAIIQPTDIFGDKPLPEVDLEHPGESNSLRAMTEIGNFNPDYKDVDRIVFFFKDKTFAVYTPSK